MPTTQTHFRTCHLCEAMCGLEIQTEDQTVISIKGDKKDPFSRGHICPKAVALKDLHEDPDRLKQPLRKTATGWETIGWDEAFEEVVSNLQSIQEKYGKNSVGIYQGNPSVHNLGTALFAPNFVRSLKTLNRFSATSVDQLPHHLAALHMFGHAGLLPIPDINRTDVWIIMGGNPLVSNGSIMTAPDVGNRIRAIQKRGGKVITIDPRFTETSAKADEHLFIKPGTDVWLLLAFIRELFEQDKVSLKHLDASIDSNEVEQLKALVAPYSMEQASEKTGISMNRLYDLFETYIHANSVCFYGRMGISVVEFGGLSHWALNCLNILSGNMDHPGGMMFPSPAFDPLAQAGRGKVRFGRWESRVRGLPEFGGELPSVTLAEEILTEGEGQIKAVVTSCGNPVLSVPNGQKLDRALESLEFMVSIDIYLNETTRHADIILPPATGLEVAHYDVVFHQLAIHNTAKYSPAIFEKDAAGKYDYEIYQALTAGMKGDKDPSTISPEMILEMGLQGGSYDLNLEKLKQNPHGVDLGPLESRFPNRLLTQDQKIHLIPEVYKDDLDRLNAKADTHGNLLLIGRRHLRSNNSWMHNSHRLVKGPERCTLLIHPHDAEKRQLRKGDKALVSSLTGKVEIPVEITQDIMEGVVSIPHGWGHNRKDIQLEIAQEHAGVSLNDLTDDSFIDALSGNAAVNGVPVAVEAVGS